MPEPYATCTKIDEVWQCGFASDVSGQTETDILITILCTPPKGKVTNWNLLIKKQSSP